jgi:hypothetical protein
MANALPAPSGICYTARQLETMKLQYSRFKPIEPGDLCCNCRQDCDGEGFSSSPNFTAYRVNGHPICARGKCYDARIDEFSGRRVGCGCGRRK